MNAGGPLNSEKSVVTAALDRLINTNDVLVHVTHFIFNSLHSLGSNCNLNLKVKNFSELL